MRALPESIAVVGLGVSGLAAARYIQKHQGMIPISMSVYDSADNDRLRSLALELADSGTDVHLGADFVDGRFEVAVVSPGIMPSSPLRRSAQQAADRVIGEIEFAFERSVSPWLAVTGTNGKTTVTSLCVHLLTSAGVPAEAVGNIGVPPITLVDEVGPSTALVAEVSSFQLALTDAFCPRVAVLLNITPDHIDWHGSLETYTADKARMFANMGPDDCAVIDIDDSGSAPLAATVAARGVRVIRVSRVELPVGGAGLVDGWLTLDTPSGPIRVLEATSLKIRGDHNVSNALAAIAAVHSWGVDIDAIARGLTGFEPIEHRLEPVGLIDGVEYVNDSKATNPGATIMALTAFDDRPVVLMLGGRNKNNSFAELALHVRDSAKSVVVFGEAAPDIVAALSGAGVAFELCGSMLEALACATRIAGDGETVLLSPACASFDEFDGYAHRGDVFRAAVAELSGVGTR